jgi:hypothetical protein
VKIGGFLAEARNDKAFLINWRREAGAFQARIDSFKKNSFETPLLPSSKPDQTKQCHPERSEGSPNLFSNLIMKFLEYK